MSAMQPPAWERIDDYESVWAPFDERFNFRPSIKSADWPAIDEPAGSVVYSLAPCFDGTGTTEWLRQAINFSVVWALAETAPENTSLLVLDWQSPSYRFWPRRNDQIQPSDMLGMNHTTPVPDGDYFIFLAQDLSFGTFGHPWEQTLCVFGEPLVQRLDPILGSMLPVARDHRA